MKRRKATELAFNHGQTPMHTDLTEKENRWVEVDLGIDGRRSGQSNPHQSVSIRVHPW